MQAMFISHLARSDSKVTIEISWNIMMCILWVNDVEFLRCISLAGIEAVLGFLGWMHLYYLLWLGLLGTRSHWVQTNPKLKYFQQDPQHKLVRVWYVSKWKGVVSRQTHPEFWDISISLGPTNVVGISRDSLLQQEICGKGTDDSLNLKRHFSTQQKSEANRGK